MRASVLLLLALLAGCAAERLAVSPPEGVDLSGHWHLNLADSDDPQRLDQALASGSGTGSGSNNGGGQQGGRRGRGGSGGGAAGGFQAGPPLEITTVGEILHWPGKELEVKQTGGSAVFESDGDRRLYQPTGAAPKKPKSGGGSSRVCGWLGSSLVIQVDPDDDRPRFEEHYKISSDGQRLVQLVLIKSGRMNGFSMSRVWDRVP